MINYVLFGYVTCCFLISLIKRADEDKRDVFFLRLGMFFTVMADLMMIVFHYNVVGLFFFCVVQLIYVMRFTDLKCTVYVAALSAVFFVASFKVNTYIEMRLSVFYAVCILSSVLSSFLGFKKRPTRESILALAGMTLFLLCDINVAFFNLVYDYSRILQILIWVFYLPSQLLISLSGKKVQYSSAP